MPYHEDKPASFIAKLYNILRVTPLTPSPNKTPKPYTGIRNSKASVSSTRKDWNNISYLSILDTIDSHLS